MYSIVLGALLGIVFEIFRTVRVALSHKDIAVFIEDVLFVFIFFLSFFTYCGVMAKFSLRGFILVGMLLGFVTYLLTIGRAVRWFVRGAVLGTKRLIWEFCRLLYKLLLSKIVNFFVSFGHSIAGRFVQNKSTFEKTQKSRKKALKRKEDLLYNDT